jgi:hypothetical protein
VQDAAAHTHAVQLPGHSHSHPRCPAAADFLQVAVPTARRVGACCPLLSQ